MRLLFRSSLVLVTGLALLGAGHGGPASGAGAPPSGTGSPVPTTPPAETGRTVTLLSGDKVVLGPGGLRVIPGPGRAEIRFQHQKLQQEDHVIPSDAVEALARGVLDRRLFNVSRLVREGNDDSSRSSLPVIVEYAAGAGGTNARARVRSGGAQEGHRLDALGISTLRVDKRRTGAFWAQVVAGPAGGGAGARHRGTSGIARVWLDGKKRLLLDRSVPQIGAPTAWKAGLTGRSVKVAVLDSGYDPTHPDLAGRVATAKNFTSEAGTADLAGHGTHVAATVAGSGAASGGRHRGVAPDANLLIGKVCVGSGECPDSAILAGMTWAAEQRARVVNLSLGGRDAAGLDPLEQAVNRLTARTGTLFVIAAGNDGSAPATVGSPGSAEAALTVGAVDRRDRLAGFSSRGPRVGDEAIKPDLTAPGVDIVAARAKGTLADEAVDARYAALSGTSMATPHVAGAAAILAQQHPTWRAAQLKAALTSSATPVAGSVFEVGSGRVDVPGAIALRASAGPSNLSFGVHRWPHTDDRPVTRTITYRNDSPAPLTLALRLQVSGPNGRPAPAGMFRVPDRVVVPAAGTVAARVTVNTRGPAPDGWYSAVVTATGSGGTVRLRTPLAVNREPRSYDVTVRANDRAGRPVTTPLLVLAAPAIGQLRGGLVVDGRTSLRLPAGRWHVALPIQEVAAEEVVTLAAAVNVDVDRPRTVVLDARRGKPVNVVAPEPGARLASGDIGLLLSAGAEGTSLGSLAPSGPTVERTRDVYATPTASTASGLTYYSHTQWAKPNGTTFADSPYVYNAFLPTRGRIPADLTARVARTDLATVTSHFAAGRTSGGTARLMTYPSYGVLDGGWFADLPVSLPRTRTDYYSTAGGTVTWNTAVAATSDDEEQVDLRLQSTPKTYRPGRQYTERWGFPVLGPGLPATASPHASRRGDIIDATGLPLLSDSDPSHHSVHYPGEMMLQLYRGSTRIPARKGLFEVPAAKATYRLVATVKRDARVTPFSSTVTAEWTFTSARTREDRPTPLPLTAVRYQPVLDAKGTAPAGWTSLGLVPQSQPQTRSLAVGRRWLLRAPTLSVSYDDGRTWTPARIVPGLTGWRAVYSHPTRPGAWVALRSTITDRAGRTGTQTVMRAYRLR